MRPFFMLVLLALLVSVYGEDVDSVDTEVQDTEIQLKCDACMVVAYKFGEAFGDLQNENKGKEPLDEDIIHVAESVCDDVWAGYGITEQGGEARLSGPGTDFTYTPTEDDVDSNLWSHRLQDMCDEFLGEIVEEKKLYNTYASGNSLQDQLCKGDGTYGACVSSDWGPWPGADYDDYEDNDDFEYIHDEF